MIYIIVPGDREENKPCSTAALHNFQGALLTTNGNVDVVSEASGIVELDTTVSGAWMLAAPRRENCIPNVSRVCYLALIIGVRAPNSRGRPAR